MSNVRRLAWPYVMASNALTCRRLKRDLLLLAVMAIFAFGVVLFADNESRWVFATTVIACCLVNPTIRFTLLHRGVIRPASRQTPKKIQFAEALLILAHMFRVMFVGLAPFAIASVAIEMTTDGSHGAAHVITTILSGIALWAATIAVTCYMVRSSQRDLERLYLGNPPAT
ncbi:hypothetical protein Poly51_11770 [Rubripirellula tenax]|uniref:Uncharacterized protein n=1 Tax=Rubripirellula tenax TaxID=2528015 RepID=A0A5C6FJB2_9BACT|nr:hypothetical protein Poly51_11770 [Rubripirellula tenax]